MQLVKEAGSLAIVPYEGANNDRREALARLTPPFHGDNKTRSGHHPPLAFSGAKRLDHFQSPAKRSRRIFRHPKGCLQIRGL